MKKFAYEFSETQQAKLEKWYKKMRKKEKDSIKPAIGGAYTYCFSPNGIGMEVSVKHINGEEIDLTEVENW